MLRCFRVSLFPPYDHNVNNSCGAMANMTKPAVDGARCNCSRYSQVDGRCIKNLLPTLYREYLLIVPFLGVNLSSGKTTCSAK
ncbi:uncharacterized protein LOC111396723 isoform X2 [Olea europaea var. sylvestris]|uniref:uncharacterized protein LOC111396723 isoform X2 n=1 Tax=Olea europaea var. sylvestris TaxID=158386 RepID=UPI000C1D63D1|nr:uncharacterized protein LOC111396723 isoform X2 [Olea europaea var. sylvestris]